MDIAKWAYKTLGNSSLFRSSELWRAIDPLVYSVIFPEKMPADTEKKVEERKEKTLLQAGPESTKTYAEVQAEIDAQLKLPFDQSAYDETVKNLKDPLDGTDLSTDAKVDGETSIESYFDDTRIDYNVFFLE
jgi:hypothetical protein